MKRYSKRLLLSTISVILVIIVTVVVIEVIASITLHYLPDLESIAPDDLRDSLVLNGRACRTMPDPYLGYRIIPNQEKNNFSINSYGLRANKITEKPATNTIRILIFGGSVAWGFTSQNNDDTIASYLEDYLSQNRDHVKQFSGKSIEVLNAGVPGYVLWQEALLFILHLRKLCPHIIIFLDGYNDVRSAMWSGEGGIPTEFARDLIAQKNQRKGFVGMFRNWLMYRLERLKSSRLIRRLRPMPFENVSSAPPGEVADAYGSALRLLGDVARIDGVQVMAVIQPLSMVDGGRDLTGFEKKAMKIQNSVIGQERYFSQCYQAIRLIFKQLAKTYPEIIRFDATQVFAGEMDNIFVDDCHLTQKGRKILSTAIGDSLIAGLKDPVPKNP